MFNSTRQNNLAHLESRGNHPDFITPRSGGVAESQGLLGGIEEYKRQGTPTNKHNGR
jgi:hypothetical protein